MALDFEDKDRRGVVLDRHPILVPKITALPHGVRPPSLGRGDEILCVRDQHQGGLARRETQCLDPSVDLRSVDSLFGAKETTSSAEDHERRKHLGKIKNSHSPARPPVPSRNVIKQLPS